MELRSWFRNHRCVESFASNVEQALRDAGFVLESDQSGAYGVVCFELVDDELLAILHDARRDARRRVLAVASPEVPAGSGTVWRLIHAGAADVYSWSGDFGGAQIAAQFERWMEVDEVAARAVASESLAGESPAWRALVHKVVEAARFSAMPVLLLGESGTGKELIAKLISVAGAGGLNRFRKELITVDCGALVPELSGSEFFGHERGAFTGAHAQREGAFALADGATLLLDEIGEIPPALQAQLLRAIQEKTYKRVGGNVWQKTNFRLVCATNRDLQDLVRRGQFRLDLYHRIAGCVFHIPTLRERREDVLTLARHFLRGCFPGRAIDFDASVSDYLLNREYSGNIRELRQLVERIAHRHAGPGPITAGDVPSEDRPGAAELSRAWPDDELERSIANALATGATLTQISRVTAETAIRMAIQAEQGNLRRAAGRLGVTDRALQMRRAADRERRQCP